MTLSDRNSWRLDDPAPGTELQDINLGSVRALALVARSPSHLLRSHFVQIMGAVTIMSGMDYHYRNFVQLQSMLATSNNRSIPDLRHEAIAWINRVGQFYYFCNSALISKLNPQIGSIESVLPFRNKHAAHRSIDAPRQEDSAPLQEIQAMMLSDLGGTLWTPRSTNHSLKVEFPTAATHCIAFQLQLPGGSCQNLEIERIHPAVMSEAYRVLEVALKSEEISGKLVIPKVVESV